MKRKILVSRRGREIRGYYKGIIKVGFGEQSAKLLLLHEQRELAGFGVVGEEFGGGDASNPLQMRSFSERTYPAKRNCQGICPETSAVLATDKITFVLNDSDGLIIYAYQEH